MQIIADLHTHTLSATHAFNTLDEMAAKAAALGYAALAITDHGPAMPDAPHMWHFANQTALPLVLHGVAMMYGAEANVMDTNGGLDFAQSRLRALDWVVASIHSPCIPGLLTEKEATRLWLAVAENPYVDCIGHSEQQNYRYDYDLVTKAFAKNHKVVELNGNSVNVRRDGIPNMKLLLAACLKNGCHIALDTDAHSIYRRRNLMKYTIGIDLGGTTMTAGLVDEAYNIVGKITRPTRLPRPAQDLERALADLCRAVAKDCKIDFADVSYVGIGTPGSVNFTTGFVGYNTNFGYYDWNLGPDLEALLGCKVYVENDANAAAFGEYIAGGAKGFKDAVVITLGTGIGSGIILGGKILRGFNFAAGEMGHTVIVKGGRKCNCGRYGCWERYASSRALSEDAREAMTRHPESMMWKLAGDIDHVNAKIPFDAMEAGDATAKAVVDNWIEYVACGISNVVNTFEPEAICIGGGVSNQGETLLAPIRKYVEEETKNITTGKMPAIRACVLTNDAGVIGAAALANSI